MSRPFDQYFDMEQFEENIGFSSGYRPDYSFMNHFPGSAAHTPRRVGDGKYRVGKTNDWNDISEVKWADENAGHCFLSREGGNIIPYYSNDPKRRIEYIYNRMGGELLSLQLPCAEHYLKCRWKTKKEQWKRENLEQINVNMLKEDYYDTELANILQEYAFGEMEAPISTAQVQEQLQLCRQQYQQCLVQLTNDMAGYITSHRVVHGGGQRDTAALNQFYELAEQVLNDDLDDFTPPQIDDMSPEEQQQLQHRLQQQQNEALAIVESWDNNLYLER